MKQIEATEPPIKISRQEQPVRIVQLANDAYDAKSGRVDWEAVTGKAGLPLIECLEQLEAAGTRFPTRSLPGPGDWPAEDIIALREFVAGHLDMPARSIWTLAAIYINVETCNCQHLLGGLTARRITPAIYALVNRYRKDGLKWAEIQARFPLYPHVRRLERLFYRQKALAAARLAAPVRRAVWTKEETKRVKEVVWQYYRPGDLSQVTDVLVREFPNTTRLAIKDKVGQLVFVKATQLRRDIDRMSRLVDVHGADWERIGREMDVPPSMAQLEWLKHQESTNPVPHANRPWSPDDLTQLQQLVAGYRGDPVDWGAVGKQLGRHSPACITMHYALKRPPPAKPRHRPTDPVSLEVQRQLARGSSVDWEQVSQAVGLDVRQCLELSQIDEGKGRWIYDPDTFLWATAERMKALIADNYPAPMMANFRAVSNYLWLDMDDCIRMEGVLRGEMVQRDELKAQITEMRRLGMMYKDIGVTALA
ncbi:hypothetical protein H4R19_002502 [Coemansia spiralis]|nr:hypothetical protein H4R19_002502 [Coemansia spiralis]